jgi:hypothetical protein
MSEPLEERMSWGHLRWGRGVDVPDEHFGIHGQVGWFRTHDGRYLTSKYSSVYSQDRTGQLLISIVVDTSERGTAAKGNYLLPHQCPYEPQIMMMLSTRLYQNSADISNHRKSRILLNSSETSQTTCAIPPVLQGFSSTSDPSVTSARIMVALPIFSNQSIRGYWSAHVWLSISSQPRLPFILRTSV